MKNLLYLLTLFIFACSSNDDNSCNNFSASTSASDARQIAISFDEDYNNLVSQYGQPISEGYFTNGNEYYFYVFMFEDDTSNDKICYTIDDQCVTSRFRVGCSNINTVDDCDECVVGGTRIN